MPANGFSPNSTMWARMISPYSSGKASSDPRNSSSGRSSGVFTPARAHFEAVAAQASRSAPVSEVTSASEVSRAPP